ncbi:MAG TPA: ABC transporter permease [Blastocatellia bacterium]|nr:ABC transporter permease [Blastocatellia bacterium]
METILQDLRYGVRVLFKKPGFTALAVIALALGIGANSAIFSVVNAVLLRSLPYDEPERLVMIWGTMPQSDRTSTSAADFIDYREQNQVFEQVAAFNAASFTLTGTEQPEQIRGARVSADFFSALRVQPTIGRAFQPEDDKPGAARVVVLGQKLWQRRFNSDQGIIGNVVTLNGQSFTVIGIMPAEFQFTIPGFFRTPAELWTPIALIKDNTARGNQYLRVIARLKPDITLERAQAEMTTIAGQLQQQYPGTNTGLGVRLIGLHEQIVGNIRPALLILLGTVGFVLLIACANVANLLLARAAARQKEIAIKLALGATRRRLARQLLTESMLLALIGGAFGILLALWSTDVLVSLSPANLPRVKEVGVDGYVLGFTLLISILTGALFGLVPALQASKPDLNETLKEGSRGSSENLGRGSLRRLLVIFEIAAALVLLIGAGLMIKSFLRLNEVNAGFNPRNVLTMMLSLPRAKYKEPHSQAAFFREALERINNLPGVESVGAINDLPLGGDRDATAFAIEGRAAIPPGQQPVTEWRLVNPDYFKAMSVPLIRGRAFSEADNRDAPPVVVINDSFARRFFPDEDPLGKRVILNLAISYPAPIPREVVGVVGDVRDLGLDAEARPEVYAPYLQETVSYMALMVKANTDPAALAAAVRGEVLAIDKDQPISAIQSMEQIIRESVAGRQFNMTLFAIFAGVALLLAAVGIYGVMAYSVTQRTHEIGIRVALGANHKDVLRLIVGQGMAMAFVGVGLGLGVALVLTRVMSSLLYEVSATDPATFVAIPLLLAGVALLACYVPARRAMNVDPMIALRYE